MQMKESEIMLRCCVGMVLRMRKDNWKKNVVDTRVEESAHRWTMQKTQSESDGKLQGAVTRLDH